MYNIEFVEKNVFLRFPCYNGRNADFFQCVLLKMQFQSLFIETKSMRKNNDVMIYLKHTN